MPFASAVSVLRPLNVSQHFAVYPSFIAASAHARAAIYTRLTRNYRVGLFGWMDGVYANEGLACVQTLLSTARESQIGTRCCEHARAAIYAGPKVDLFGWLDYMQMRDQTRITDFVPSCFALIRT